MEALATPLTTSRPRKGASKPLDLGLKAPKISKPDLPPPAPGLNGSLRSTNLGTMDPTQGDDDTGPASSPGRAVTFQDKTLSRDKGSFPEGQEDMTLQSTGTSVPGMVEL